MGDKRPAAHSPSTTKHHISEDFIELVVMNLLSLPNEMLACVLKYLPHEPLKKVRSLNRRLDEISKRNQLDRRVLTLFRFSNWNSEIKRISICLEYDEQFYNRSEQEDVHFPPIGKEKYILEVDVNEILEQFFSKIRKLNNINIQCITINEETVTTILKNAKIFRNAKLRLDNCELQISTERWKNVVNSLKVSEILLFRCQFRKNDALTDKIVADFNLSMKVNLYYVNCSLITINSVHKRVYCNKLNLVIEASTSITFRDMITFLKTCKTIKNDISLGVLLHGSLNNAAKAKTILREEFNIDDINTSNTRNSTFFLFRPYADQGLVTFQIPFINIGE